jgi:hypothetical protein
MATRKKTHKEAETDRLEDLKKEHPDEKGELKMTAAKKQPAKKADRTESQPEAPASVKKTPKAASTQKEEAAPKTPAAKKAGKLMIPPPPAMESTKAAIKPAKIKNQW